MIDLDKAAALLHAEGLRAYDYPRPGKVFVAAPDRADVQAGIGVYPGGFAITTNTVSTPDEADALAAALARAAALCRRIERECQQ